MGAGPDCTGSDCTGLEGFGKEARVLTEGAEQSGKDLELEKQVRGFCLKNPLWV